MNTLSGRYYDGRHPIGSTATLIWKNQEASLIGDQISARYATPTLKISPRIGHAERFIAFPDGGQLLCADSTLLDTLPQSASEGLVAWLERRWFVALIAFIVTLAALAAGYLYALPRVAEYAAERIPMGAESDLGMATLGWMEQSTWLGPTETNIQTQQVLRARFTKMVEGLPYQASYRLEFRRGDPKLVGANAFALPGGTIVVTDELVQLAQSPEDVLAVLAHEVGHVELRHTMRHVIQNSGIAAAIAALTSDGASLTTAVAGLPAALAQTHYSREFEAAADDYGFRLLVRNRISPSHFADMMERLEQAHKEKIGAASFLASHPATPERIASAREAARKVPDWPTSEW